MAKPATIPAQTPAAPWGSPPKAHPASAKLWAQAGIGDLIFRDNSIAVILDKQGAVLTRSFALDHTRACESKKFQDLEADGWQIVEA